jgi:hypothetical protein
MSTFLDLADQQEHANAVRILQEATTAQGRGDVVAVCERAASLAASLPPRVGERVRT